MTSNEKLSFIAVGSFLAACLLLIPWPASIAFFVLALVVGAILFGRAK